MAEAEGKLKVVGTQTPQGRDISQYCTKVLVPSAVSWVNLREHI